MGLGEGKPFLWVLRICATWTGCNMKTRDFQWEGKGGETSKSWGHLGQGKQPGRDLCQSFVDQEVTWAVG